MAPAPKTEPAGPSHITDTVMTDIPPSPPSTGTTTATIERLKIDLYNHCNSKPSTTTFTQHNLMATNIIPNNSPAILNQVAQALMKSGQFKLMKTGNAVCWRCIPKSLASAHTTLDRDSQLVYSYIESAGREGVWSNMLNRRTNFHKVVMDKCIKVLEQKRLIKTVPNYRHPNRRTYMLWGLQPAEDVTGGPFYSDGDLDEEFVRQVSMWIEKWIVGRSWWFPVSVERDGGKKRKRDGSSKRAEGRGVSGSSEQAEETRARDLERWIPGEGQVTERKKNMQPFPPNYIGYPTVAEITNGLNDAKISKTTMKISDTQLLVDILIWDGKVERLRKPSGKGGMTEMYRAIKYPIVERDAADGAIGLSNGAELTEAPCGKCPVFDVCEDGGKVSARTCPYFQDWLKF